MKTKYTLFLIVLFTVNAVMAQKNAIIKFDTTVHEFGQIKEDGGKAATTFYFTNKGTDTLKIIFVKPGCGCTTAEWTKTPVLPGQRGFVKTEYDPMYRPGVFGKAIVVTSNATNPSITLVIKGNVIPRKKTILDTFPVRSGNLLLKTNHLAFLDMKNNEVKTDTFEIYNNWIKPMSLSFKNVPDYISCKAEPQTLQPLKKAMIIVTFNAAKKNDLGLVYDNIDIATNDTTETVKSLTVSANIIQDFSKLTDRQKKRAPKIVFEKETYDFGTVTEGDTVRFSFDFKNTGTDELLIYKTKASCGCTASSSEKSTLKKDESSKINVQFNTSGKKSEQHKSITVISNDPERSILMLNIQGNVKPK